MIYIFHGDNQKSSREAFSAILDSFKDSDILHLDAKSTDENSLRQFLNTQSFLALNYVWQVTQWSEIHPLVNNKTKNC